ncbi:GIY-YIG nuclease family protein [Azospirillum sp. B506]|uniref:GIY-YIG nuclease family protein n=1 Tax=Azospirillum sp. B506 TaxID=137721 RepID=UPI000A02EC8D|nr:GIY-YIG nuclease family protein [Azospirillum sp. B506]
MVQPTRFKISDFGGEVDEICNSQDKRLYKPVTVTWTQPAVWHRNEAAPIGFPEEAPGYLYILTRNHHRAKLKDEIVYVGITNNLKRRFDCHPKAEEISSMRGETSLSIGNIDFHGYKTAITHNRREIEELEHIFIWALWKNLWNERKMFTLPGMGRLPGRAWHITNEGYHFSGRMPRELVYPWMLVKPRADRSRKA